MVQQTKDSTFTEYGLSHAESGVSNADKQLSASVAAKKLTLQDVRIENPMTMSKSIESPLFAEGSVHGGEVVQIAPSKRHISESLLSPMKSNAGGGHIVYVRRKPETESTKTSTYDSRSNAVDCPRFARLAKDGETAQKHACNIQTDTVDSPHLPKTTDDGKTARPHAEVNEPVICTSDAAPFRRVASPSFSSTRSSVSPSLVMSGNISSTGNVDNVHVDCTYPSSVEPITLNFKLWEERYSHLQGLLRMLDQADQDDYVQMLRSLSSVELSKHAIELEKRSMKLQLEEAHELQRVRFFDTLGKYPNNVGTASPQQEKLRK